MKTYLTIVLVVATYVQLLYGQTTTYHIQIDTIIVLEDKILAKYKTSLDSIVTAERTCYLYPWVDKVPQLYFFGRGYINRKTKMTKIVWHGESIEYFKNGNKIVYEYSEGILLKTICYDKGGKETTLNECIDSVNIRDKTLSEIYLMPKKK